LASAPCAATSRLTEPELQQRVRVGGGADKRRVHNRPSGPANAGGKTAGCSDAR
jgi:hypothetical protein